jgi:hypothetical protein
MTASLKKLPDKHLLSKNSPAKVDERKVIIPVDMLIYFVYSLSIQNSV